MVISLDDDITKVEIAIELQYIYISIINPHCLYLHLSAMAFVIINNNKYKIFRRESETNSTIITI